MPGSFERVSSTGVLTENMINFLKQIFSARVTSDAIIQSKPIVSMFIFNVPFFIQTDTKLAPHEKFVYSSNCLIYVVEG